MLNKKTIVVLGFGVFGALLLVAGCAGVSPPPATPSSSSGVIVGQAMPDIRVRELGAAGDISLRALTGKVVLVDIWASWCAPCREELPMLDDLATRLKGKGVDVVAISIDEDEAPARAFLAMKSSWRLRVALDSEQRAQNALSPPKMPSSYVIDRAGVLRAIHAGFERSDVKRLEVELLSLAGGRTRERRGYACRGEVSLVERARAAMKIVVVRNAWALPLMVVFAMSGCASDAQSDPSFWRPSYEPVPTTNEGTRDPTAPMDDPDSVDAPDPTSPSTSDPTSPISPTSPTPSSGSCGLGISVTTASFGGQYAPANIGAVWIADGSGRFVKTLRMWANRRIEHLVRWKGATASAGLPDNKVDAVTAATLTGHGTRSASWNCTDSAGQIVPNGYYEACFEMTEGNGAGPFDCVGFNKSELAFTLTPESLPSFKKRSLVFSP